MSAKVCIGCEQPEDKPHRAWCPVVTGRLSSLDDRPPSEWLGSPDAEGDCPASRDCFLCTLDVHPPSVLHEAWGTSGDKPARWWSDDGSIDGGIGAQEEEPL